MPEFNISNPRRRDDGSVPFRPSYNPENAQAFKPLFDKMIQHMSREELTESATKYRTNTLYIKANDALKWLIDNQDPDGKYALLRCRIRVRRTTDGIVLEYKRQLSDLLSKIATERKPSVWKEEFFKWLETAQPYDIFERQDVIVTEDTKEIVMNVMNSLKSDSAEVAITSSSVKVMR